jgi:hypothetical protein
MKTKQHIWIPRNKKKVSFADPLFQVFGESSESEVDVCFPVVNVHHETCLLRFDPMLDELLPTPAPAGYPTKDDYSLRPKIFALVDLCGSLLTIRLIRKICENVIYLDITCFIIVYILGIS